MTCKKLGSLPKAAHRFQPPHRLYIFIWFVLKCSPETFCSCHYAQNFQCTGRKIQTLQLLQKTGIPPLFRLLVYQCILSVVVRKKLTTQPNYSLTLFPTHTHFQSHLPLRWQSLTAKPNFEIMQTPAADRKHIVGRQELLFQNHPT